MRKARRVGLNRGIDCGLISGALDEQGFRRARPALASGGPQAQGHDRPAGGTRTGSDLAVLRLGQAADDEQADADAAEPAAIAGLALEEPVEDALVVAVGDADALVFHRDLDPVPTHAFRARGAPAPRSPWPFPLHPGPDADRAAVGRVLEGVLEQLPDDDVGGHGVAAGGRQVGGDVRHDDVLVRQRPERGGGPVQHGSEVERAVADGHLVGPGPRAEQQLLDQPAERPGPLRDGPHRGASFCVRELVPPAGQRAGESLHHGDGRPQLVAGGGQEQVLRFLKLLGGGDVTEVDDQLPAVGERGAQDVEPAPVRQLVGERRARIRQRERRRFADGVLGWRPGDPVRGRIPLPHQAARIQHGDAVGAAVDDRPLVGSLPDHLLERHRVGQGHAGVPGQQLEQFQLDMAELAPAV